MAKMNPVKGNDPEGYSYEFKSSEDESEICWIFVVFNSMGSAIAFRNGSVVLSDGSLDFFFFSFVDAIY